MRKLPLLQALVVLLFISVTIDLASYLLRAVGTWLAEIRFYWQSGWNFALRPPQFHDLPGLSQPQRFGTLGRLVVDWPIEIMGRLFYCLLSLLLIGFVITEPDPRSPPKIRPPARLALGFMIMVLVAYVVAVGLFAQLA